MLQGKCLQKVMCFVYSSSKIEHEKRLSLKSCKNKDIKSFQQKFTTGKIHMFSLISGQRSGFLGDVVNPISKG